jgi:hypothetical protein
MLKTAFPIYLFHSLAVVKVVFLFYYGSSNSFTLQAETHYDL